MLFFKLIWLTSKADAEKLFLAVTDFSDLLTPNSKQGPPSDIVEAQFQHT